MKKITTALVIYSLVLLSASSFAQNDDKSFNNTIKNLSSDAAKGYVGPGISSFGSNLNTGWVTKSPEASKLSFNIELKVIAMGSFIDDAQKTFSSVGSFNFTESQADDIAQNATPNDANKRDEIKQKLLSYDLDVGISGPTILGSDNRM